MTAREAVALDEIDLFRLIRESPSRSNAAIARHLLPVLLDIIARERDAALAAARPHIREECAKVAEEYGPARPITVDMPSSIIRGRWEGEQAASANIAAKLRSMTDD